MENCHCCHVPMKSLTTELFILWIIRIYSTSIVKQVLTSNNYSISTFQYCLRERKPDLLLPWWAPSKEAAETIFIRLQYGMTRSTWIEPGTFPYSKRTLYQLNYRGITLNTDWVFCPKCVHSFFSFKVLCVKTCAKFFNTNKNYILIAEVACTY